jgi:tetratricopeptide (TPR) repeat protein
MSSTVDVWHRRGVAQLTEHYGAVASGDRGGRTVFVAGDAGSGRSDALRAFAHRLGGVDPAPLVVGGSFERGEYVPWPGTPTLADGALGLLQSTLSLGGQLLPIAGLAAQLLSVSRAGWHLLTGLRSGEPSADLTHLLPRLLRATAAERPLACLVDDADRAESGWWTDLVLTFAQEIASELPLLLVLAVDGPVDLGPHEPDETETLFVARRLGERELASWLPLSPLSREEIASCVGPCEPQTLDALQQITGGRAAWARDLWSDWQRRAVVVRGDDGRWRMVRERRAQALAPVGDVLGDRLAALAGTADSKALDPLRTLLAYAALEGQLFTADALARVLGRPRDEVIDLLDDVLSTDASPDGLIEETDRVDVLGEAPPRHLWRYRFRAPLVWLTLRRYGFSDAERPGEGLALADALEREYGPQVQRIAHVLARLLAAAGESDRAKHFRRMQDVGVRNGVIAWRARRLLAEPVDPADTSACNRATPILLAGVEALTDAGSLAEALECARTVARIAPASDDRARGLARSGQVQISMTLYAAARVDSTRALELFKSLGNVAAEAVTLADLAWIDYIERETGRASAAYERARELFQKLGDRRGEATARGGLALIERDRGAYAEADAELRAAIDVYRDLGEADHEAGARNHLATSLMMQRRFDDAREQLEQVVALAREVGDVLRELSVRHKLARIDLEEGRYEQAAYALGDVLTRYREHGMPIACAEAYTDLGRLLRACGQGETARNAFGQALEIWQTLDEPHQAAHTVLHLAGVDEDEGLGERARDRCEAARDLFEQIGDVEGVQLARRRLAALHEVPAA